MKKADWYFDFISPFAYLQFQRLKEFEGQLEIRPIPILFGALLNHWEQLGPAEIVPKRQFTYRFAQWQAAKMNVPYKMPEAHPFNPLPALRLCLAAGPSRESIETIWKIIFQEGKTGDSVEAIEAMATALNIRDPAAAMGQEQVKTELRQNTEIAIARSVFGVPTFDIDGELFWGVDATEMVQDFIQNPDLFKSDEMQRVSNLPTGISRRK